MAADAPDRGHMQVINAGFFGQRSVFDQLSEKASVDALHVATATINGMDYLLTWNCRHIANATLRNAMAEVCRIAGYEMPIICTPLELIQELDHD